MVTIYPTQIQPHHNWQDPRYYGDCWRVGDRASYQGMTQPSFIRDPGPGIASWGVYNPDREGSDPLRWYKYSITSWSGSYNVPTPFTASGWNIDSSIRENAVVKKIVVEYSIAPARYSGFEGCKFYLNELDSGARHVDAESSGKGQRLSGCHGNTPERYGQTDYKIILSGFGNNREVSGQGLSYDKTVPNNEEYPNLSEYSSVLYEGYDKNLTIKTLKNTQLIFIPPRNLNWDIGRIVMKYIRLRVEYEAIPPAFHIDSIQFLKNDITTCENSFSIISVHIQSATNIVDKTRIKISGSAISHAKSVSLYEAPNIIPKGDNDTVERQGDDIYWDVVNFSPEPSNPKIFFANLLLKVQYDYPGIYNATATVLEHRDSQNYEQKNSINVVPCQPNITFHFLDNNNHDMNMPYHYVDTDNTIGKFQIIIDKNQIFDHNEQIIFDSSGLNLVLDEKPTDAVLEKQDNLYIIKNIKNDKNIVVTFSTYFSISGSYTVNIDYKNPKEPTWNANQPYKIIVKGSILPKEYFKLRLEDGTDVRYNSLMFTQGDNLETPLWYDTKRIENYLKYITIIGERKRIPVGETQYIYFDIDFNCEEDITLKNVLAYIEINTPNNDANNIIIGASKNVSLLEMEKDKICSIESIKSNNTTKIKFAVKSEKEIEDVQIKIKPYNYVEKYNTGEWIPAHVMFKDIPNIKISIEGVSDLMCENYNDENEDCYFWLYYHIQNLSNTAGKNLRFQLKEPSQFRKIEYVFPQEDAEDETSPYFNENNRIILFNHLDANSAKYTLAVKYKATRKGFYTFKIHTLDDENTLDDDQYQNSYQHDMMVNITSDVYITTSVNNNLPYLDELIDFNINVQNKHKEQKYFMFDIYDIGSYNINHNENHYEIEYENYENGVFVPAKDNNYHFPNSHTGNKIGNWRLDDVKINDECDLTLSVRPRETGNHVFKTVFTDYEGNQKEFYNEVKVLERKQQISFNVYHAVDETGINNCSNCNELTKICDDDFINLKDDIYYVFEIQNNSRRAITNATHVYARLPKSFLTNNILCYSRKPEINQENNLIHFTIPQIPSCEHENSKITFCIKVRPNEIGTYISNFMLSTRNSKVLHKKLTLTVDTEFNNRQIEHEISIYNFNKTNKYYRYEVDNIGNIFKFYNIGDKSYRMIDIESFYQGSVETYKGTNLRKILNDIKKQSKFVEPLFFREGNNHIANKAYELYPDGFIRRFGLLNSEVFHYTGQLPKTSNLVDKAMIWDIDKWDTKVWAGDIYDNGVFGVTIDYNKIPSNFNILETDKPIQNLQALIDNVKPYGSKAICYYSASVEGSIAMNIDNVLSNINHNIKIPLYIPNDFDVISLYNRHDNTIKVNHDLKRISIKAEIDYIKNYTKFNEEESKIGIKTNTITTSVYGDKISKTYTNECDDLIANAYNASSISKNIDITKPYDVSQYEKEISRHKIINTQCTGELLNKEFVNIKIYSDKGDIYIHGNVDDNKNSTNVVNFIFMKDDINKFTGFKIIKDDITIQERNFFETVKNFDMQIQIIKDKNNNQHIHFWGSINSKKYYHIGYMILSDFNNPKTEVKKVATNCTIQETSTTKDAPITFQISDKLKNLNKNFSQIKAIEKKNKWLHLDNINKKHHQYASFSNNIDIDAGCDKEQNSWLINVPKLVLKYDDFNINNLDEIVDIHFKIQAQSNKKDFEEDIHINLFKDGDSCLPVNNISRQISYPESINNINQEFLTTINVEQENITICSDCLKTTSGYYDTCQYCQSPHVLHYNEPTPATACYNCGWIIDGWHDYCYHCLSQNINKIQVDFNKTYCNDCNTIHNKYYEYCPHCFSKNVTHLTNNIKRYQIFNDKIHNIEPINIKIDNNNVNVCNLIIPINAYNAELNKLKTLNLKIEGTNYNDGKYYYCEACGHGGLGNYNKCPYCNSKLIHNENANHTVLETYLHTIGGNEDNNTLVSIDNFTNNSFESVINLKTCALQNYHDKFSLLIYAENKKYNETLNDILNLNIADEDIDEIINGIMPLNFTLQNISIESKYKNEREWIGLDKLEGTNHTSIEYKVPSNAKTADAISFNNFNIEPGEYEHAYLYISGLIKSTQKDIKPLTMHIKAINGDITKDTHVTIEEDLFNKTIDIIDILPDSYLNDKFSIQIRFKNLQYIQSISITDCNITTEKLQYDENIHDDVNIIKSKVYKENNNLLFTSSNNDLWGLNDTQPYYMSGKQLDTNLICYIDCGKLNLQEYIRIYDIEMIIYYKAKSGKITTQTMSLPETTTVKQKISSINGFDENDTEQLLSGQISKKNGELLGSINFPNQILNNLEYNVTTVNAEDDLINDIPLRNKIAQAFTIDSTTISTVHFNYYGKNGYPSEIIDAYLCKDNDGKPGAIIESSKVYIPTSSIDKIDIDLDSYNLNTNQQYWIVLEDKSANKNNYHRFKYNDNKIGDLLIYQDTTTLGKITSLSFSIDNIKKGNNFNNLPVAYKLRDNNEYKIHYILYRYNVNEESNVTMSELNVKNGYKIRG